MSELEPSCWGHGISNKDSGARDDIPNDAATHPNPPAPGTDSGEQEEDDDAPMSGAEQGTSARSNTSQTTTREGGEYTVNGWTQWIAQWMLHLIALGFLAAIVRNPRLLDELERESVPLPDWSDVGRVNDALPTPLSKVELQPSSYPQHATGQPRERDHSLIYHDVDVGALVTVCTCAITFMLIYGAALGKPAHLLPFFCLQIFDFAITVLTATGYLCYLRSIHRLVAETRRVPWRAQLLQLPAPALALVVLSSFLVAVLLKGYFISIVWRCYKYLTMRAHALQTPFVISSDDMAAPPAGPPYAAPAPDYSSLLPDYEEAVKQTPPPSYRAATLMAPAGDPPTTPQQNAQHEQPQPQPQATNTMVVLPQPGNQASV